MKNFFDSKEFAFLSLKQIQKLSIYYQELIRFKQLFLTKRTPEQETLRLLKDGVVSGNIFLKKISKKEPFVDIGSGAGFPGLVLSILEDENPRLVILVEPSLKRSEFLRHCIDILGFPYKKVCVQAIPLGPRKEKMSVFKAFAPLQKTLRQVKKFMPKDSVSYHFKSLNYKQEWEALSLEEKKLWELKVLDSYLFENQKRVILKISQN